MDGLSRWYLSETKVLCNSEDFVPATRYNIVGVKEFIAVLQDNRGYLLIDTRNASEFTNTDDTKWKNMGHIKNALNIPATDIDSNKMREYVKFAGKPVLLYGGSNSSELYTAANVLAANGFKNVYVLSAGIFDIRWTAANIKGMAYLNDCIVDVPE